MSRKINNTFKKDINAHSSHQSGIGTVPIIKVVKIVAAQHALHVHSSQTVVCRDVIGPVPRSL